MNRHIVSVVCLLLLATFPACRKCKKEKKQQEEVNTMINVNDVVEDNETEKSIIKF